MENKYYVPSIEEFHIGFEYERDYGSGKYEKLTYFTTQDTLVALANGALNYTRVKYLDREDIESLGFYYVDSLTAYNLFGNIEKTSNEDVTYYVKQLDEKGLMKCWIEKLNYFPNHLRIVKEVSNQYNPKQVFDGEIKNKSQLKQLLIWLNIIPQK